MRDLYYKEDFKVINLFLGIIAICMVLWTVYMAWFAWMSKDCMKMYKGMMKDFTKSVNEINSEEIGE